MPFRQGRMLYNIIKKLPATAHVHHYVEMTFILVELVDANDAWMVHVFQQFYLVQKGLLFFLRHVEVRFVEDLHGAFLLTHLMSSKDTFPERSLAQYSTQFVVIGDQLIILCNELGSANVKMFTCHLRRRTWLF
jgi:hypothetical protein